MKTFIDRWYALIHKDGLKRFNGKRAVIVAAFGDEDPTTPEHLVGMFRRSFDYLGVELVGVLGVTASEPGEVAGNAEAMKKAFNLGRELVGGLPT